MAWPRAAFPFPSPAGLNNSHPLPDIRMFAFACDSMDALGLRTYDDVSLAVLVHSNLTRPEDRYLNTSYDAPVASLGVYVYPEEARALLVQNGFIDAGVGAVQVEGLEDEHSSIRLSVPGGQVDTELFRAVPRELPDAPLRQERWLVVPRDTMMPGILLTLDGLLDGYTLPGAWNATGSVPFAQWYVMAGPKVPATGALLHDVDIRLEVAA